MAPLHLCVRYCRRIQSRAQQLGGGRGWLCCWITSQGNSRYAISAAWIPSGLFSEPLTPAWLAGWRLCASNTGRARPKNHAAASSWLHNISFLQPWTALLLFRCFTTKRLIGSMTVYSDCNLSIFSPVETMLWIIKGLCKHTFSNYPNLSTVIVGESIITLRHAFQLFLHRHFQYVYTSKEWWITNGVSTVFRSNPTAA